MSCPDCFKGSERIDSTPTGKVTTLYGLPTYIAEPSKGRSAKGIVVIIPDAFGWEFVNNRLMVDEYARTGDFTVFLPDFMNGTYYLPNFKSLILSKHNNQTSCGLILWLGSVLGPLFEEAARCYAMQGNIYGLELAKSWPLRPMFICHKS